jgi:hypothetical protein
MIELVVPGVALLLTAIATFLPAVYRRSLEKTLAIIHSPSSELNNKVTEQLLIKSYDESFLSELRDKLHVSSLSPQLTKQLVDDEYTGRDNKFKILCITFGVCFVASAAAFTAVAIAYLVTGQDRSHAEVPHPTVAVWPMTGDSAIDEAHQKLNDLQVNKQLSETTVIIAMRSLFYKPVFREIRAERDTGKALFAFCRADILLETYVGYFQAPGVRHFIITATDSLISLQDQLADLYGPTFNRGFQCKNTTSEQNYISTLPPRRSDLNSDQIKRANTTLKALDDNLHNVNLID